MWAAVLVWHTWVSGFHPQSMHTHAHAHTRMHSCTHICMHTQKHAYICVHAHTHIYMPAHMQAHTCVHIYTCIRAHTQIHILMDTSKYICTQAHRHTQIHACTHTYTSARMQTHKIHHELRVFWSVKPGGCHLPSPHPTQGQTMCTQSRAKPRKVSSRSGASRGQPTPGV